MSTLLRRYPFARTALSLLAAALAVVAINQLLARSGDSATAATPAERPAAPSFSVATLAGGQWSLDAQRGKVVLVNLFATWCPPCRAEMPDLVAIARDYRARGVETLGLSLDEGGASVVQPFLKRYQIDIPVGLPEPGNPIIAGVTGIPVTLLIDRSGRVAHTHVGQISADRVRAELDGLLAEK
jgi:thiol-disulfide isomerase/thioredoxin